MSDTFFTKSGSSPGDADCTRPLQHPLRKKSIKRAFTGMAGSPLARIDENVAPQNTAPKRGRPPITEKRMTAREQRARHRVLAALKAEQEIDDRTGGEYGPGRHLIDAPAGKGLLVSGGHGTNEMSEMGDAAQTAGAYEGDEPVGLVNPSGFSPDVDVIPPKEFDEQFAKKHKISKSWSRKWQRRNRGLRPVSCPEDHVGLSLWLKDLAYGGVGHCPSCHLLVYDHCVNDHAELAHYVEALDFTELAKIRTAHCAACGTLIYARK